MRTGVVRGITIAIALAAALACTSKPANDAWFPLGAGRTWSYTLTPDGEGMEPRKLTVAVVGPEEVGGATVARERIEVDGQEHFLFVGADEKGVYRHATQSAGEAVPSVEGKRDYFLTLPLEVGRSWKSEAGPAFLEVADMPVPIESTVVSTTDTVRTPAGEFANCVKVHVTGTAEVRNEFLEDDEDDEDDGDGAGEEGTFDPVSGTFTIDEETWYAKDVGVVKSIVTETFKLKNGGDEDRARVTTELQAFTR